VQHELSSTLRISNVDCEQLLLNIEGNALNQMSHSSQKLNDWKELAFLSACHSVKDISLYPASELTPEVVSSAVLQRFTNRHYQFHSNEHFLQIQASVIQHLQSFFAPRQHEGEIMVRFETLSVFIEELDIELSQHFHMIYYEPSSHSYRAQILMKDPSESLLQLYYHMTALFAFKVFKSINLKFEVFYPLEGKVTTWQHDTEEIQSSFDYILLLKTLLLDHKNANPSKNLLKS